MRRLFRRHVVDDVYLGPNFRSVDPALEDEGSRKMAVSVQMLIDPLTSQWILIGDADVQSLSPEAKPHSASYHLPYHNY